MTRDRIEADLKAMAVARKVSGLLERVFADRVEPGELLAPAYLAAAAGRRARHGCFDYLRERYGRPGSAQDKFERALVRLTEDPPAPPVRPAPLSVWCESRPERHGLGLRERVLMYLHLVEGLALADAGRPLGLNKWTAMRAVAAAVEQLTGRRPADMRREA